MLFLRKLLSIVLIVTALVSLVGVAAFWGVRFWATPCEVPQVFKQTKSIQLFGQNYAGVYDVALVPLTPNATTQMCPLFTITHTNYLNLLDRKAWLVTLQNYQFAFYETPQTRLFIYLGLGFCVLILVLAYFVFKEKDRS